MITTLKHQIRKKQADFYINKLLYKFNPEWFSNKRIALIGGADSVLQQKHGDFIDDFDVVVRINKGVELIDKQKDYVGTKTDILFHSFLDNSKEIGSSPITVDLWKKHKVQHIVYSKNYRIAEEGIYDIILFGKKSGGKTKFSNLPKDLYMKSLEALAPQCPTTGFIAINTILNCKPKELYISGITFFKTPHNGIYRPQNIEEFKKHFNNSPKSHNPEREYAYFKNLYLKNKSIIRLDNVLDEIINHN
ncbi:glycosyltransferase family 29 protein [Aequorivita capsosiphonis]|uniref:glycosyltransferase family 29 protein n=1 Tax=Aequorivita capsosiphonis TaxID=487317 RepID=UPI00041D406B|nr:glycosyltransferase family 29 protein [Aequorivita capsosiphonis]